MPAHEPDKNRLNSTSTVSQVHEMRQDAHVHVEGRESVPSRPVSDRCTSKRHLLSNGSAGCSSRKLSRHTH
eukprot:5145548-Prorocentrum_lima.AAC.1